jgi:hypothetical protein
VQLGSQKPPRIDASPDDPAWQKAAEARFPASRETTQTRVRMLWDSQALYLFAHMNEPNPSAMRFEKRPHDAGTWLDDSLEVFFSPKASVQRYLQLIVNPLGSYYDGVGSLRTTDAGLWDSTPEIATGRDASGWSVELRLTWKDMGVAAPKKGELWTGDLRRWRYGSGQPEYEVWSQAPARGATHHPEAFGWLKFE